MKEKIFFLWEVGNQLTALQYGPTESTPCYYYNGISLIMILEDFVFKFGHQ